MKVKFTLFKKSHWLLMLVFISAAVSNLKAQVSVTATAGTPGPTTYTTVNSAFAAINAGTHQGVISILITGNTTEPATPTPLLASGGTSAYTAISIMPSGGSFTISSAAAPTANRGIIELAGADNVTIDGDDVATTGTQNLSIISATATTAGIACVRLSSNSTTGLDGANNNTIKNCIITGARTQATTANSRLTSYGIQFSDGISTSSSTTGAYASINTTIQNNTITRCYYGAHIIGNSDTYLNTGLKVIGNKIGGTTTNENVAVGINANYTSSSAGATSALISENNLQVGFGTANTNLGAITLDAANAGATVNRNYIHDCVNPSSGVWGMYGIYISSATSNTAINITNNIIRDISGYPVSSLGNQYGGIGIFIPAAATGIKINNNTIAQLASGVIGSCIQVADAGATISQLQNNIFVNNVSSAYSCGLYLTATTNISGGTVNNNDYYINASGVFGYYATNVANFTAWKTATTKDANSYNLLPNFVSATDMHIVPAQVTYLESGGASVASTGVNNDFDNDNRPGPTGSVNGGGTAPDIGADEFDGIIPPLPPVVNSGSVSPAGNQCVAVSHNITANITAGATAITSAYITYRYNGVVQPTVALTGGNPTGTSDWAGTIPVASPSNAQVTWTVTAADISYTVNFNGTAYQDEPTNGVSAIASSSPSPLCAGSTASLNVDVIKPGQSGTVGLGAITLSSYNNPIYSNWANNKMQILYLASELQAAGFRAGNLTSLALNLNSTSATGRSGFTINMAHTSATAMTTTFLTPTFTQVYTNATYAPVVGANSFAFGTGVGSSVAFNWDGISNLAIQICWDNIASTATEASTATGDNTAFSSVVAYNRTSTTGTVVCGLTVTGTATYTARPNLTFIGTRLSPASSYTWTDGATNLISATNPQTVTLNTTTNYTVTASISGCPITATTQALVNPPLTAPTVTNSTQCGNGIPTAMVDGGTTYKWYAAPTGTAVLQSGTSQTYTTSISATTDFYVSSLTGVCESPRSMVTATVTLPDAVTATASSASLCPSATATLTAVQTGTNNVYSYTWTPTPVTGSGMAASVTGSIVSVSPTTPGTYVYNVTASDGVCTTASSVSVMLSVPPTINASITPTMVCSGSTVNLNATTNVIGTGTVAVGAGTNLTTTTEELTSFCNRRTTYRMQTVYTAAELNAAGLYAGNITSITYSISSTGTANTTTAYTVKCGTTAVNAFTDYVSSAAFVTTYTIATRTHAIGLNTITFTTPFLWDGVSNMVVEVSHGGANGLYNAETTYSTLATNQTVFGYNGATTGTPSTKRLNIIFGGQTQAQGVGNLTWQWNPGAINSNTATVTPVNTGTNPAVMNYTITGTSPVTTCSNSAVVTVTVNPVPTIPVALNSSQCGVGTPTASVSGGTDYKWYAGPTSTIVLQSGASTTYTAAISATTTFYVSSYNANCESGRAAVTASVSIPDAITATSTNTAVCPGQTFTLTAANTGTNNTYSYTWAATPATGSGIATSVTGATTAVSPTTPGSYNYVVTGTDAVCTTTAVVTVVLTTPPQIIATANPSISCSGSTVSLNAVTGTIASGTVGIGVTSMTLSAFGDAGNPYNYWYGGQKEQYIFTAAELAAAGLYAGNITSLSFDVVNATALSMSNFSMTVGHTAQTAATFNMITTGLNPVYFNAAQNVTAGINNYVFSTPFNWNGTDNIVVSLSWSNVNGGSTALTSSVRAHNAGFTSTAYLYADNTAATSIAAATTSLSAGVGGTSQNNFTTNRPNIIFTGQRLTTGAGSLTWEWNPGAIISNTTTVAPVNPGTTPVTSSYTVSATDPATTCSNTAVVTLTINPIPTVSLSASTGSICSGTTASLTATGATTYSWMPAGGTSSVAAVSPAASTVYTVTGTSLGCSNTQTINLDVTTTPTVIASASPSVICAGATVSLTASGATTYSWMPNSSTSGTTTATPTTSTIYSVSGTTSGCTNTKTVSVTVNNVPTITVTTNPSGGALCTTGATATLTATGTSTAYAWSNSANTASTSVAPSATTVYTVTGTNSCGTVTATATIAVATTPTISASTSSTLSCTGNPVVLTANATAGVTYSWSTGATTTSISVSPSVTTTYTVSGTNACGTATATVVQNVSTCIGVDEVTGTYGISIYPNPANDYVNIAIPSQLATAGTVVEVTDAIGKLVMKETLNTDVTTLRISKLEDGVYFFKVITNNQTIKVGKVVKH